MRQAMGKTSIYSAASFKSSLKTGAERFLSQAIVHSLAQGFRSPDDFLRHFKPLDLMQALESAHELRAEILVKAAGERAVAFARGGKGPYILEMMTYRYRGHSMSDPAKYRSKDEVNRMRAEHDCIDQAKKRLLDGNMADENALKAIDKEVKDIVAAAAQFAQDSPEPDPSELWTDVLKEA